MSHLVHLWQSLKPPLWRFPSIAYVFHDARRVFKPCSNVHRLLLQFPEMLPSDSCTLSSGGGGGGVWGGLLLSSSSYCLVPMSCETRSWPDHRFNNTPWYMRFPPPLWNSISKKCGPKFNIRCLGAIFYPLYPRLGRYLFQSVQEKKARFWCYALSHYTQRWQMSVAYCLQTCWWIVFNFGHSGLLRNRREKKTFSAIGRLCSKTRCIIKSNCNDCFTVSIVGLCGIKCFKVYVTTWLLIKCAQNLAQKRPRRDKRYVARPHWKIDSKQLTESLLIRRMCHLHVCSVVNDAAIKLDMKF